MRKYILVFVIITIAIAAFFIYREFQQRAVIKTTLSARSKEFLKAQQKDVNSDWQQVQIEDKRPKQHAFDEQRLDVGKCGSIIVPVKIESVRQDGPCTVFLRTSFPTGSIALSITPVGFVQTTDAPGARLRHTQSEDYTEQEVQTNGKTFLVYTKKDGSERTAFYAFDNQLFSMSTLAAGEEKEMQEKLLLMLGSLVLTTNN